MSSTSSAEDVVQEEKSMRRPLLSEIPTLSGTLPTAEEDKQRNDEAQLVLMAEQDREYKQQPLLRRVWEELRQLLAFVHLFIPQQRFITTTACVCVCGLRAFVGVGGAAWRCRSA